MPLLRCQRSWPRGFTSGRIASTCRCGTLGSLTFRCRATGGGVASGRISERAYGVEFRARLDEPVAGARTALLGRLEEPGRHAAERLRQVRRERALAGGAGSMDSIVRTERAAERSRRPRVGQCEVLCRPHAVAAHYGDGPGRRRLDR